MDIDIFSKRIRALRGSRSQREVAEGIGTTQQSLGRYESGKRKPDLEIIERLAVYFEVSADYLLGLNDQKTPDYEIQSASYVTGLSQRAAVGGTGIIIVVGVAMDTIKQMKSQMTSKQYKSFVGK